jgi:hypothetical protein
MDWHVPRRAGDPVVHMFTHNTPHRPLISRVQASTGHSQHVAQQHRVENSPRVRRLLKASEQERTAASQAKGSACRRGVPCGNCDAAWCEGSRFERTGLERKRKETQRVETTNRSPRAPTTCSIEWRRHLDPQERQNAFDTPRRDREAQRLLDHKNWLKAKNDDLLKAEIERAKTVLLMTQEQHLKQELLQQQKEELRQLEQQKMQASKDFTVFFATAKTKGLPGTYSSVPSGQDYDGYDAQDKESNTERHGLVAPLDRKRSWACEYAVTDINVSHLVRMEGFDFYAPPYAFDDPVAIAIDMLRASELPAAMAVSTRGGGQSKPLSNAPHLSKWRFAGKLVAVNGQSKPLTNAAQLSKWRFKGKLGFAGKLRTHTDTLNPEGINAKGVVISFVVDPRIKASDETLTIVTLNIEVRIFKSHEMRFGHDLSINHLPYAQQLMVLILLRPWRGKI